MTDNNHEIDDFGPDYVTIVDEDGKSYEMEFLDSIEMDGKSYMAFCDASLPEDSEAVEVTIFRVEVSDDGEELVGIDDEEELNRVYEAFLEQSAEDDEE